MLCTCPICGTIYPADPKRLNHGRQTTCSRDCSYKLRARQKSKSITKPCAVCGTPVTRPPSKIARSKTEAFLCSPECHYAARADGTVGREVSQPYNIPQSTRMKMADLRREMNARRKAEGRYAHSNKIKKKISNSLRKHYDTPGNKPIRKTSLKPVRWPHPKQMGWVNGCPEWVRKKISATVSKAIAEGRIPRVSKLEKDVGEVLKKLGITVTPQHGIRDSKGRFAAVVDYFIPSLNTALEVNGTFWHADPREFPNGPTHASQKRTQTRYQRKMNFLRQRGITLAEVWEIDFKADPTNAVKDALGLH